MVQMDGKNIASLAKNQIIFQHTHQVFTKKNGKEWEIGLGQTEFQMRISTKVDFIFHLKKLENLHDH